MKIIVMSKFIQSLRPSVRACMVKLVQTSHFPVKLDVLMLNEALAVLTDITI